MSQQWSVSFIDLDFYNELKWDYLNSAHFRTLSISAEQLRHRKMPALQRFANG